MQRTYQGRLVRLTIDPNHHLWLDYGEGEVHPVPWCYSAGAQSVVLPYEAAQDLGPEAYGQFVLDAGAQGITVLVAITPRARAEWRLEQQEQEPREP